MLVSESPAPPASIDAGGTFQTAPAARMTVPASVINHFIGMGATSLTVASQTTALDGRTSVGGGPSGAVSPNTEAASATNLPRSDPALVADTPYSYSTTYNPVTWQTGPGTGKVYFTPGNIGAEITFVIHGIPTSESDLLHAPVRSGRARLDHGEPTPAHPHLPGAGLHPTAPEPGDRRDRRRVGSHHRQHLDGHGYRSYGHGERDRPRVGALLRPGRHGRVGDQLLVSRIRQGHLSAREPGRRGLGLPRRAGQYRRPAHRRGHHRIGLGHLVQCLEPCHLAGGHRGDRDPEREEHQGGGRPRDRGGQHQKAAEEAKASITLTLPTKKIRRPAAGQAEALARRATTSTSPPPVAVTLESLAPSTEPALCPPTGTTKCEGNIIQAVGNFSAYTNKKAPIVAVLKFFYGLKVPAGTVYMLKPNGQDVVKLARCTKSATGYNTPCVDGPEQILGSAAHDSLYAQDTVYFTGADPAMGRRS